MLGRPKIPAIVHDLDDLHTELAEIDENIARSPLTAMEQTKAFARRKEIYETLHPETKTRTKTASTQGGKKAKDPAAASFAEDTAAKTGTSPRTVQRDVAIGQAIPDEIAELIKDTPIADNKRELKKLARLEPEEQKIVAQLLAEGEVATVSEAITSQDELEQEPVDPSDMLRQMVEKALDTWFREFDDRASNKLAAAVLQEMARSLRESSRLSDERLR
jgi:ParB-like chromosome segregation protein Spo0J